MRKITLLLALLCYSLSYAQWDGYTVTSISTTPATSLETGYYLMRNNHGSGGPGWMYVGGSSNVTSTDIRKTKIRSSFKDIEYVSVLDGGEDYKISQPITTYDRNLLVFKITNNGDGTCTIQCHNGQYVPSLSGLSDNANLATSTTPGVLNWHQYIEGYFSFEEGGMGIATTGYSSGAYVSRMLAYSARTDLGGSNPFTTNSSQSFSLFKVEMQEPSTPTDRSDDVKTDILPWFEATGTGYFYLTQETKDAYSARVTAATTSCTDDEYNALAAIVANGKKMPETGYYRLQSAGKRAVTGASYIAAGSTGLSGKTSPCLITVASSVMPTDASTVLYLEKQTDGTYIISTENLYVQNETNQNATFGISSSSGHPFHFISSEPGNLMISTDGTESSLFNESNWQNESGFLHNGVVKYTSSSTSSYWTLEEAPTLTINLNAAGTNSYATTCLPFDVTLASDATAYVVQVASSGDVAHVVSIGQDIPADTPVLIISETQASSVVATITSGLSALSETNDLLGTYMEGAQTGALVLNAVDGKPGFYPLAATSTLAANRAFLDGTTAVRSLLFNDEVTAISSIVNAMPASKTVYDLQGRRVQKPANGIYVINGKKVVVK